MVHNYDTTTKTAACKVDMAGGTILYRTLAKSMVTIYRRRQIAWSSFREANEHAPTRKSGRISTSHTLGMSIDSHPTHAEKERVGVGPFRLDASDRFALRVVGSTGPVRLPLPEEGLPIRAE